MTKMNNLVSDQESKPHQKCEPLPGTVLRIFLPPGAVINLLNLIELTSPSGVCLIVRFPFLGITPSITSLIQAIQQAGGTVEFTND